MKMLPLMAAILATTTAAPAIAGHHEMPKANIVETAIASPDHETLVAAVKAANLVETLSGPGPFTVFAPTDDAFEALPDGTVATLLQPSNREKLQTVLTYHVVPGKVKAAALLEAIKAGGGSTELTTVEGGKLKASVKDGSVVLTDELGGTATVVATDLKGSNGVIHVTNAVSMPG